MVGPIYYKKAGRSYHTIIGKSSELFRTDFPIDVKSKNFRIPILIGCSEYKKIDFGEKVNLLGFTYYWYDASFSEIKNDRNNFIDYFITSFSKPSLRNKIYLYKFYDTKSKLATSYINIFIKNMYNFNDTTANFLLFYL